ncbi:molybdopterin-dependent oxidoreductase [Dissulfurirhabdus thermomarina]|uniref:Molybdopterin-dependent oxidoreductase n=1 Tax=Dissulfurirhabdus thermomarina TaxID=1765737 RepID=A0A6N9TQ55_DISTH|nr:molybdopterin-dependent oxidoreductase [Dissulfurirhabdus thermomarina]NMX23508.1 molybdopterin-dependent oxidoreductase [Dissulfurirhabdus thermomarina]
MGLKVREAAARGTRLVVIDPRRTEVAAIAEAQEGGLWLRLRPGTNIPLLNGLLHCILEEGLLDTAFVEARTENLEAVRAHVADYPPEKVAEITGVPADDIRAAARLYAGAEKALILYGLGVAEHKGGTAGVMALANLVLATGHVGRPHTGINPLRGQNNVQGACDMGTLPYAYPGYQPADDAEVLERFAKAWGVKTLPAQDGLLEPQMYEAAIEGRFKGLYVVGYDPAQTQANVGHVHRALQAMEFVVVQDLFLTETARFAHVVLPAACFYEKDGTFTSGERRVRRVRKAVEPPGEARADWEIVCAVATAMGFPMHYDHPADIMREIASLTPSYAGISYDRLGAAGQVWPCPAPDHPGTPLLHSESFPRGKGRFAVVSYVLPEEDADDDYPLVLVTGRRLVHYNNGSMTRRCEGFDRLAARETVEVHPEDAGRLGLTDGAEVRVVSRRGEVPAVVSVTRRSRPGSVFMSFHFQDSLTNLVTSPGLDPKTLTPEYKVCAVRLEPGA